MILPSRGNWYRYSWNSKKYWRNDLEVHGSDTELRCHVAVASETLTWNFPHLRKKLQSDPGSGPLDMCLLVLYNHHRHHHSAVHLCVVQPVLKDHPRPHVILLRWLLHHFDIKIGEIAIMRRYDKWLDSENCLFSFSANVLIIKKPNYSTPPIGMYNACAWPW